MASKQNLSNRVLDVKLSAKNQYLTLTNSKVALQPMKPSYFGFYGGLR